MQNLIKKFKSDCGAGVKIITLLTIAILIIVAITKVYEKRERLLMSALFKQDKGLVAASTFNITQLATNTAVWLGKYNPSLSLGCFSPDSYITDYSAFTYDSSNQQLLMFGGGHATVPRDDVDVLSFNTLEWQSAYAPTPLAQQTVANFSTTTGGWISNNRPMTRHTYDMLTYAPNVGEMILLPQVSTQPNCIESSNWGTHPGKIWHYNPATKVWRHTVSALWNDIAPTSEYDPVSGKIIVVNRYGIYTYDPITFTTKKEVSYATGEMNYGMNLVYYPPNDKFYYILNNGTVFEVTLNRANFSLSTVIKMTGITGNLPNRPVPLASDAGETGWAYDSYNQIIGGGVTEGVFYAFDPIAKVWDSRVLSPSPANQRIGGTDYMHTVAYDTARNMFIFMTRFSNSSTGLWDISTWAYRYTKNTGVSTVIPPSDTAAPSAPSNLTTSNLTTSSLTLNFQASTDNVGVTGYKIFRNSTQIATTSALSFNDTSLTPATSYSYTVIAFDAALNSSQVSQSLSATTLSNQPIVPPVTSTNSKYRSGQYYLFQEVPKKYLSNLVNSEVFNLDTLGPTYRYVDNNVQWPWKNPGGDWLDKNMVKQGPASWFSIPAGSGVPLYTPVKYSGNVTDIVKYTYDNNRPAAIYLKEKNASRKLATKFDLTNGGPVLNVLYKNGQSEVLNSRVMAASSQSSDLPLTTAVAVSMPAFLEFERPKYEVASATMSFTVVEHWSGSNAAIEGYLIDPPLNTNPVQYGVAANAGSLDQGITSLSGILGAQRYLDGTTKNEFISTTNYSMVERNFDPAIYGTGATDTTKLPHVQANKWINTGSDWNIVPSTFTGDQFEPLTPGLGALRIKMAGDSSIQDGHIGGSSGTLAGGDANLFLPEPLFGRLDNIFVRYYFRIGGPYDPNLSNRKYVYHDYNAADPSKSTASFTTMAGKWGIVPDHSTSYGGYSGSAGSGHGWQMRLSWYEAGIGNGGPDDGGFAAGYHLYDFCYRNPAGHNYGCTDEPPNGSELWGQYGGMNLLYANKWYQIETELKLNTVIDAAPGYIADGYLKSWIDGKLVYESYGMVFRTKTEQYPVNPELIRPVRELGVRGIKLDWFHGGKTQSTFDRVAFYTGLVWGTKYIGPMNMSGGNTPIIPTVPAPTLSLTTSSSSIMSGTSISLTWTSTNATTCTASGSWSGSKSISGTQSITPTATGAYVLNCSNAGGQVSKTVNVTVSTPVVIPVPTVTLTTSSSSITEGSSITLTWSSTNAVSCTASGVWTGSKQISGSQTITPTSTGSYILTCTNTGGSTSKTVNVTVNQAPVIPVPTLSFTSNLATISQGSSISLTWTSTNATTCTASGSWSGSKSISGTQSITPTATGAYVLNCSNAGGQVSKTVNVEYAQIVATTNPDPVVQSPTQVTPTPQIVTPTPISVISPLTSLPVVAIAPTLPEATSPKLPQPISEPLKIRTDESGIIRGGSDTFRINLNANQDTILTDLPIEDNKTVLGLTPEANTSNPIKSIVTAIQSFINLISGWWR